MIAALDERGVPVVFVTGRPLRWAEEVFEYVGAHGLAVVSNGALVWDVARDRVDLTRTVPVAEGLAACRRIRDAVPGVGVRGGDPRTGSRWRTAFLERHPVPDGSRRGPLDEVFDEPALKVLARHEELDAQEFWDRAAAAVGRRGGGHLVLGVRAAGDQRPRRDQGLHAGAPVRPDGGRGRRT